MLVCGLDHSGSQPFIYSIDSFARASLKVNTIYLYTTRGEPGNEATPHYGVGTRNPTWTLLKQAQPVVLSVPSS